MTSTNRRNLGLLALAAFCSASALAGDDSYVTNRLSLSARVGFGISARFKGMMVAPAARVIPGTGDRYNYDDGYIHTDVSGDFGGQTWYWGYDNSASQVDTGNNNILLSRTTSASVGASKTGDDPGFGAELLYTRLLGTVGHFNYGFEAGINFLNYSVSDSRPHAVGLARVTDAYAFVPGTTPPSASPGDPYQGSFEGPGFVIGDTPVSSTTSQADGVSTGSRTFDADIWGLRIGPTLEYPISQKLKVSVSGGFAAALIDARASWRENIVISGVQGPTLRGSGTDWGFVFGGYIAANAAWELNDRWSIVGSVQYQYLDRYSHEFSGRTVEADLSHGIFITFGVGYKF